MKNLYFSSLTYCFLLLTGSEISAQDIIIMSNQTITTCSALLFDSGGENADYSNDESFIVTIIPDGSNNLVKVVFSDFSTEGNWDFLKIYNGNSISAPLIASYSGSVLPESVISSASDGSLTFQFTSDGSSGGSGWKASISCYQPKPMVFDTVTAVSELPLSLKIGSDHNLAYGVNVKTKDVLNPLNLQTIKFKTCFPSDCKIISKIVVSYSGGFNVDTSMVPLSELNDICNNQQLTINKSLASGDNYFWIYINLIDSAEQYDSLKIQLLDLTVGDTEYQVQMEDSLIHTSILERFYGGEYTTDLTLGPGIIKIDNDITIADNAVLTILPGTVMSFMPAKSSGGSHKIIVKGNIIARGTLKNQIKFASVGKDTTGYGGDGFIGIDIERPGISSDTSFFSHCIFEYSNWADEGVININASSNVKITNCVFKNNHAYGISNKGTLYVENSVLFKNYGGIYNAGKAEILNTSLYNNFGSGIVNQGNLRVINSTISNNKAQTGQQGYPGSSGFCNCSNSIPGGPGGRGADGGNGGGILNDSIAEIINSTIFRNSTGNGGSGGNGGSSSWGFCNMYNPVTHTYFPVPCSSAAGLPGPKGNPGKGGGIYNSGILVLKNSIVANNIKADNSDDDIFGTINTSRYNIISLKSNIAFTNDSIGNRFDNPLLDTLKNNGGITPTCALLSGSPAINALPDELTDVPVFDQRGYIRTDNPDIGSFEYGAVKYKINIVNAICDGMEFMSHSVTGIYNHYLKTYDNYDSLVIVDLTVKPFPAAAGIITGTPSVCKEATNVLYSVPTISDASSYMWTLPIDVTGSSVTNSISVDFGSIAVSDIIKVKGHNDCGDGTENSYAIAVNDIPDAAGPITGTAGVCKGSDNETYNVPVIAGAISYAWALPAGAEGTSTTNTISVSFGNTAASGSIKINGHNECGDGNESFFAITLNDVPDAAGPISGTTSVCKGVNSVTYSVPGITDATNYIWTLSSGATGASATNNISVDFGGSAISGNIKVNGQNDCGNGSESSFTVTVNEIPAIPVITLNNGILQSNAPDGNQWYFSNNIIQNATNNTYLPFEKGTYYAIVTVNGCSSQQSNIITFIPTGFNEIPDNEEISIYPNPTAGVVKISIINIFESDYSVDVYNNLGSLLQTFKKNRLESAFEIDFGDFTNGLYLVRIYNTDKFYQTRVIKR